MPLSNIVVMGRISRTQHDKISYDDKGKPVVVHKKNLLPKTSISTGKQRLATDAPSKATIKSSMSTKSGIDKAAKLLSRSSAKRRASS